MNAVHRLVVRDDWNTIDTLSPTMASLLIALLVLVLIGLCLIAGLFIIRMRRKSRQQQPQLPLHNPPSSKSMKHRRLTITAAPYGRYSSGLPVYNEKETLVSHIESRPASPIPEIRITFPEEEDETGKRKSGRVVVVRIGENGAVGLGPCSDETLPPYQISEADRFQSLDLERMGGLKEKGPGVRWS